MTPLIGLQGGGAKQAGPDIVSSLDGRATDIDSLAEHGLSYASLNPLGEHGLIVPEYNSKWTNLLVDAGLNRSPRDGVQLPSDFKTTSGYCVPIDKREGNFKVEINGILITHSGMELARVVDIKDYA